MPTRSRKGSADALRGAAALIRRVERQAGRWAQEARIVPLRAVDTPVLTVGGPAGDEEPLGVTAHSLPDGVAIGRGDADGACKGEPLGHRYAVALGLALAAS